MNKRTCIRWISLLICAWLAAAAVFVKQAWDFTEIIYAADRKDELAEELYCDSLELLAICVQAEAGNQPLIGRRMVADVILNRVDDRDFPNTIEGVITQRNQFTSYWDGGMDRVSEPDRLTIRAVQMELEQRSYPGLMYFQTGSYSRYGTPWRKVGDHFFSTK